MRVVNTRDTDVLAILRQRGLRRDDATEQVVKTIIEDVRQRGDSALLDNGRRFDSPSLQSIHISTDEITTAAHNLGHDVTQAFIVAHRRICDFHQEQLTHLLAGWQQEKATSTASWQKPVRPGEADTGHLGQRLVPLNSVGVYVPGGNAPYPSSVFMNVLPAKVAGVERIVVTSPARKTGDLLPAVTAALGFTNANAGYKVGGASAIAALALGTESITRVDKIVGPGNRYVNEAKRQLWGQVGLDGYAGPSEVCVVADDAANAEFAAADLLTQVEHAPDNAGFLITLSEGKMNAILSEVKRFLEATPRAESMRQALADESLAIIAKDLDEVWELVNVIAPEHITVAIAEPERALENIQNAGCILLGEYTPESGGDYCLGPSHTLPTSGAARWQSPVNVMDFLKIQSISYLTRADIQPLISTIETLGTIEGFPMHAFGGTLRREPL